MTQSETQHSGAQTPSITANADQSARHGAQKPKSSRTMITLVLGWILVFGVLTAVLTSLKMGGTEPLKSQSAPTPSLGEPTVRDVPDRSEQ